MKILPQNIALYLMIILVSLIYGLPHIILLAKNGNNYNPLVLSSKTRISRDKTYAYAPFVNYILKGNFPLKDVYVEEYKDYPTPFIGETFPAAVYAILSKVTGSVGNAFIAADFIFPPIVFLLLFLISKQYIKNTYFLIAISFLATISRDFISVIPYPKATVEYLLGQGNNNYFLYLSRAFHPQLTYIVLLGAILTTIKLVKNPKSIHTQILLGIFTGLLFYNYVFYWTYFLFFLLLYCLFLILRRKVSLIKPLIIPMSVAIFIGSYYLINIYLFSKLPFYMDFVTKSSSNSYPFVFTSLRYLILAILFYILYKKHDEKFYLIVLFLLSGVLIGPVSKLLLGQDLETLHYLRRALMPIATIVLLIGVYQKIMRRKILVNVMVVGILLLFTIYGFYIQTISAISTANEYIHYQYQTDLFNWLNANTKKDEVVGTLDTELNLSIPLYTKNKTFFPPTDRTVMPTSEGVKRYIILSTIIGIDKTTQKNSLDSRNLNSYLFVYQAYDEDNNLVTNSNRRIYAEGEIENFNQEDLKNELKKYKLDYIILTFKEFRDVKFDEKLIDVSTTLDEFIVLKVKE